MGNYIHDCNFYGVKWNKKSIKSVEIVAQALLNLTELFRSQNIKIETMLKIGESDDPKQGGEDEDSKNKKVP